MCLSAAQWQGDGTLSGMNRENNKQMITKHQNIDAGFIFKKNPNSSVNILTCLIYGRHKFFTFFNQEVHLDENVLLERPEKDNSCRFVTN